MILDLEKASSALSGLKTDEGKRSLEAFYKDLSNFREHIGSKLNDAEFRYVMQTLFNEQLVTATPEQVAHIAPPTVLGHGFQIRQLI